MKHNSIVQDIQAVNKARRALARSSRQERDTVLLAMAKALELHQQEIFEQNEEDVRQAQLSGVSAPLIKRLKFDSQKLNEVVMGIRQVAALPDPIGKVQARRLLDEGLLLEQVSFPIGVIGMVFESRPDALVQIVSLCLKSGNGIVLKGGSEALRTNRKLVEVIKAACLEASFSQDWLLLLESRDDVSAMLELDEEIDLLIPRGSNEFVRYVMDHTRIPVLGHADGLCIMYVDKAANLTMATRLAIDAKTQYPAVCNAIETLLVHKDIATEFLPRLKVGMEDKGVELRGDIMTQDIISCVAASDEDYDTEFLSLTLAIKIVSSYEDAIEHIALHSSGHTECIVTEDEYLARRFQREVDSADVFWNCSTRFADGFRFGLGAEVGVSTQKIHARGPVGLEGLMSYKWLLSGHGEIVADYSGPHAKAYLHQNLEVDK